VVSVVIVNWNSGNLLESCVRSLAKNAARAQILIVDNASTDSSMHLRDVNRDRMILLHNPRNLGFAAACNIGWRRSEGDRVLFLNPDAECLPESIECLELTFASDESVWAVGGKLIDSSGNPQSRFNVRTFPSIPSVAAEMLFLEEVWPSNPWSGSNDLTGETQPRDVDQPAAACLMVSRTALEWTDGFDESFQPAWFEDVDLCRRIRNYGGRIRYQPGARFLHRGGYSLGKMPYGNYLEIFHRNQIRYFHKHHGSLAAMRVKRLILIGLFLRGAVSALYPLAPNQSRAASAKAFWDAACQIYRLREFPS